MIEYKGNTIDYMEGFLILNGEKIKVVEDRRGFLDGYVFKVQKTQIKAHDGAAGLYRFIREQIELKYGLCWIDQIIREANRIAAR